MSARSPFRSHLLQQWTNSRRSPIVVQQWLQQATIDEEEEGIRTISPALSSRYGREDEHRSMHHSSRHHHPNLSSVESSSSPSIALAATTPWAAPLKSKDNIQTNHVDRKELCSTGISAGVPFDNERRRKVENNQGKQEVNFQMTMSGSELLVHSATKVYPYSLRDMLSPQNVATDECCMVCVPSMENKIRDQGKSTDSSSFTTKIPPKDDETDGQELHLAMVIDRAVRAAKVTHAHNRQQSRMVEDQQPFTFRKLLSSSRSGRQLIDISSRVTNGTTSNDSLAKTPAFLVTIVHDNQIETPLANARKENDPYTALDYSPPTNEKQLEDYACACAAVQSVIHSLNGDGYTTKVGETTNPSQTVLLSAHCAL